MGFGNDERIEALLQDEAPGERLDARGLFQKDIICNRDIMGSCVYSIYHRMNPTSLAFEIEVEGGVTSFCYYIRVASR